MAKGDEFFWVLLGSASFYRTAVLWGGCALVLSLLGVAVLRWRGPGRAVPVASIRRDCNGGASALDFAITLPVFMTILALVIQLAAMANDAIVTHYAAYSAARSARVWMWDRDQERRWPRQIPAVRTPARLVNRGAAVREKIEHAARFALISASPSGTADGAAPRQLPVNILKAMSRVGP